ncbi:MAG: DUF3141 domain-containing protein [Xanthomonadaceae bacterium]|nr:DUF3141 domain-containing protein [Xanthomonadaceae bacterium]
MRAIRAPIVVIASEGDNITPPPQALNWILDLYQDIEEIRANEQTIVYTVHPDVGHLGIFVSGRVAAKEHDSLVNSLDLIDTLPPGLFEMVIDEVVTESRDGLRCETYRMHFEERTLDAIRAYDDGREDEKPFQTVARFSEINEGLYSTFLAPWVKAFANTGVAGLTRVMNPQRLRYTMLSDANPCMAGLKATANLVRENRVEAPADNQWREAERFAIESAERMIEHSTQYRDLTIEQLFKAIWTNPLIQALAGEAATHADSRKPATSRRRALEQIRDLKLRTIAAREHQGTFTDAILRVVYAAIKASGSVDASAFTAAREIWMKHPRFHELDRDTFITQAKEAALMVAFDEQQALEALPQLLPSKKDREQAIALIRRIIEVYPDVASEVSDVLARVEKIVGVERATTTA